MSQYTHPNTTINQWESVYYLNHLLMKVVIIVCILFLQQNFLYVTLIFFLSLILPCNMTFTPLSKVNRE